MHLCYIRLQDAYSNLVLYVLCRAKAQQTLFEERNQNGNLSKIQNHVAFLCRNWRMFVNTRHGSRGGLWVMVLSPLSTILQLFRRENRGNPPTCPKSLQTLSHNVGSNTPRLSGILTFNVVGHMHRLHR